MAKSPERTRSCAHSWATASAGLGQPRCAGKSQLPRCYRRKSQGQQQSQGPGQWPRGQDPQLLP
eukprot:1819647-Alexandrium_andersonii.AAC.1